MRWSMYVVEPATEKQKKFLEELGKSWKGVSKEDASEIIGEALDEIHTFGFVVDCPYCQEKFRSFDNLVCECPCCHEDVFFYHMRPFTEDGIRSIFPGYKRRIEYVASQDGYDSQALGAADVHFGDVGIPYHTSTRTNPKRCLLSRAVLFLLYVVTYPAFFPYHRRAKKSFLDRAYGLFLSFFLSLLWLIAIVVAYNFWGK